MAKRQKYLNSMRACSSVILPIVGPTSIFIQRFVNLLLKYYRFINFMRLIAKNDYLVKITIFVSSYENQVVLL